MIRREKRVLLRHYLEQGMTKAAIARHVGVSRDTIYRWIATGQLDRDLDEEAVRYRPRPPVPSKLDPYKAIIEARLAEYPKLTATRLFKEVRDAGYPGSYSQVKRYVRRVRPRPPEEPVQRFETPPGHQGQVDFADFRLPLGEAARADRGAGLLAPDVAALLRAPDDAGGDAGAGVGVPVLRGRPVRVAVRPDEGSDHRGRPCRGRAAGREPGVPALQPSLGLPDPGVPSVPGADEGQGGTADPVHPRELLLRPGLRLLRPTTPGRWSGSTVRPAFGSTAR